MRNCKAYCLWFVWLLSPSFASNLGIFFEDARFAPHNQIEIEGATALAVVDSGNGINWPGSAGGSIDLWGRFRLGANYGGNVLDGGETSVYGKVAINNEGKWMPALALGFANFFSSEEADWLGLKTDSARNTHLGEIYVTGSKAFGPVELGLSLSNFGGIFQVWPSWMLAFSPSERARIFYEGCYRPEGLLHRIGISAEMNDYLEFKVGILNPDETFYHNSNFGFNWHGDRKDAEDAPGIFFSGALHFRWGGHSEKELDEPQPSLETTQDLNLLRLKLDSLEKRVRVLETNPVRTIATNPSASPEEVIEPEKIDLEFANRSLPAVNLWQFEDLKRLESIAANALNGDTAEQKHWHSEARGPELVGYLLLAPHIAEEERQKVAQWAKSWNDDKVQNYLRACTLFSDNPDLVALCKDTSWSKSNPWTPRIFNEIPEQDLWYRTSIASLGSEPEKASALLSNLISRTQNNLLDYSVSSPFVAPSFKRASVHLASLSRDTNLLVSQRTWLDNSDSVIRNEAILGLGQANDFSSAKRLKVMAIQDSSNMVRQTAKQTLEYWADDLVDGLKAQKDKVAPSPTSTKKPIAKAKKNKVLKTSSSPKFAPLNTPDQTPDAPPAEN